MEIKAYSAYGSCATVTAREGYVKLNGVVAWQAAWCGSHPNRRGVNILLVDPFSCSKKSWIRYDTYAASAQATAMSNFLRQVSVQKYAYTLQVFLFTFLR